MPVEREIDARASRRPVRAPTTRPATGVAKGSFHCTVASPQWISGGLLRHWGGTGVTLVTLRSTARWRGLRVVLLYLSKHPEVDPDRETAEPLLKV